MCVCACVCVNTEKTMRREEILMGGVKGGNMDAEEGPIWEEETDWKERRTRECRLCGGLEL